MHNRLGEYLTAAYPAGGWMVQDDGNGPYIKEWALAARSPRSRMLTSGQRGKMPVCAEPPPCANSTP